MVVERPGVSGVSESLQQRDAILNVFANFCQSRIPSGYLCPVFPWDESPESVAMEMSRLKERYPLLMGLIRFRQDSSHRVCCEETASQ